MNCDNWLVPKNSFNVAVIGFELTISFGWSFSANSIVVILSLTAFSTLTRPTLNMFSTISPTHLTLRLPKWSMSSTESDPFLILISVFNTSKISSFDRVVSPSIFSLPTLELNFILPTSDKSYLSVDWNKFVNSWLDASAVGGSPGLIIL